MGERKEGKETWEVLKFGKRELQFATDIKQRPEMLEQRTGQFSDGHW